MDVQHELKTKRYSIKLLYFVIILFIVYLSYINTTYAQGTYSTLIESGLGKKSEDGFSNYLNSIFIMAISAAALLAVVKIIIAGVKYMLSDIVTSKADAKKEIRTALLGLVIIVATVTILTVINPNLTNLDFKFTKLDPERDYRNAPTAQDSQGVLGNWQPSDPCAVKSEPRYSGANSVTTVNIKNCDEETAARILAEFTSLCEGTVGTSDNNEVKSCIVRARSANIEDVASYGDIDNDFLTTEGALLTYDVDAKCAADLRKLDEANFFGTDLARTSWLNNCLDKNSNTGGDALEDYCEKNAGKFSPTGGNKYTCQLPRSFVGSNYFEERFEQYKERMLASIPEDRQSERARIEGASFNVEWFKAMCEDQNYGDGEFKDLGRDLTFGLADYACVKY